MSGTMKLAKYVFPVLVLFLSCNINVSAQSTATVTLDAQLLDFKQVVQAIQITFAIIALIAAAVYFWADRKDQKEIDAILRKNGIKK